MFKAIFRRNISIQDPGDCMKANFRCHLTVECELPFRSCESDCFYIGENDETAKVIHYDVIEQRFDILCGGLLCDDEDDAKNIISYALSNGWNIHREVKENADKT